MTMKSLKTLQKLAKIAKILSKIAFIFAVIGVCGCAAGLLSAAFGSGAVVKWGGVTLHGILSGFDGSDLKSVSAVLAGWTIICAGEAVLAKFAETYFRHALDAGTPFTHDGAKELTRLGILTLVIPAGCAVLGSVTEGLIAGFMQVETASAMDVLFDNDAGIVLGVMFILGALLCRYGAELRENGTR